jgi:capsular exopolysaccharide synthesis family protein
MNARDIGNALRGAWWWPFVGLLLGALAAWGGSLAQESKYTSGTQFFVSTTDSASTSEAFQGGQLSQERVASYARLLVGEELAGRVVDRLDLDYLPAALSQEITATAVPDTVLIDVSVTDISAERARRIAAAVGEEFTALVAELEAPAGSSVSPIQVTVTDQPEASTEPSTPRTKRNVALGALMGLLLGAGLAVLRGRLDRSVRDPETASSAAGAPLIGVVLRDDTLEKRHIVDRGLESRAAEDYRQLRTNLQFLNVDEPPKVIMVSSAVPAEGKTTVVINLALALADTGRQVTIVEADLRKPKVTRYMGMVSGVGLTNILAGTAEVADVIQAYGRGGVSVIPAGPTPPNPGELLASSNMVSLIDQLRAQSDFVLVDAPPLLPVADSTALAVAMDGVILSVRYGITTTDQLRQAAVNLERVGVKPLGVILNIVPPKAEMASAYGYGYSYSPEVRGGKHA